MPHTKELTKSDLDQFRGSAEWFRHWTRLITFTEGVKFLAERGWAFWLIDAIASWQVDRRVTSNGMLREFQLWKLKVNRENQTAVLSLYEYEDEGRPPVLTQNFEFSDFPLDEVALYLQNKVLMLPSEH